MSDMIISYISDFFRVDRNTGLITTTRSLNGSSGIYNLTVVVRSTDGGNVQDIATVQITVLEATNSPPVWIFPNELNQTLDVLEVCGGNIKMVSLAFLLQ